MGIGNQTRPASVPLNADSGTDRAGMSPAAVREHLERILASEAFGRADRMSRFLRFIVQETLKGKGAQLKEYLIGVEVFDRESSHKTG